MTYYDDSHATAFIHVHLYASCQHNATEFDRKPDET